jgi:hypothetical protein
MIFRVEAHFLLEAQNNLVGQTVAALSPGLSWFRSWLSGWLSPRCSLFRRQPGLQAPGPALEDYAVVEEEVEHGSDGRAVAEQFSPGPRPGGSS